MVLFCIKYRIIDFVIVFSTVHDVMTFGCGESNREVKYLFVTDGWYDYGRFVYFDYYPIVKGIKVWVGEDG